MFESGSGGELGRKPCAVSESADLQAPSDVHAQHPEGRAGHESCHADRCAAIQHRILGPLRYPQTPTQWGHSRTETHGRSLDHPHRRTAGSCILGTGKNHCTHYTNVIAPRVSGSEGTNFIINTIPCRSVLINPSPFMSVRVDECFKSIIY